MDLSISSSDKDLKLIKVTKGCVLQVYGLEKFVLNFIFRPSYDLYYFFRISIIVIDFIFCQEEAVKAAGVHVHFLNRFSIEYIIFAKHG